MRLGVRRVVAKGHGRVRDTTHQPRRAVEEQHARARYHLQSAYTLGGNGSGGGGCGGRRRRWWVGGLAFVACEERFHAHRSARWRRRQLQQLKGRAVESNAKRAASAAAAAIGVIIRLKEALLTIHPVRWQRRAHARADDVRVVLVVAVSVVRRRERRLRSRCRHCWSAASIPLVHARIVVGVVAPTAATTQLGGACRRQALHGAPAKTPQGSESGDGLPRA